MGRFRRQQADDAMRKTLSSSQSLDQSLLFEAAAKAFASLPVSSPLTGANAVPITSTPTRPPQVDGPRTEDDPMNSGQTSNPEGF